MSPETKQKATYFLAVISILGSLVLALYGYILSDYRDRLCKVEDNKVSRSEFAAITSQRNIELQEIRNWMKSSSEKLDKISEAVNRHVGSR